MCTQISIRINIYEKNGQNYFFLLNLNSTYNLTYKYFDVGDSKIRNNGEC